MPRTQTRWLFKVWLCYGFGVSKKSYKNNIPLFSVYALQSHWNFVIWSLIFTWVGDCNQTFKDTSQKARKQWTCICWTHVWSNLISYWTTALWWRYKGRKSCFNWLKLWLNTLRPSQNGRHFSDDIFKGIFLYEYARISIKISLKFVPKGPINKIPALVQIMAWCQSGAKPLSEPMMVSLLTHICVTRPQWVKTLAIDELATQSAKPVWLHALVWQITLPCHLHTLMPPREIYTFCLPSHLSTPCQIGRDSLLWMPPYGRLNLLISDTDKSTTVSVTNC